MPVDQTYWLQPGESTDAYNTRIANYNATKNAAPTPTATPAPTYSAPAQPAPVGVLSTQSGATTVNQNTQKLQTIEQGYAGPSVVDYLSSQGKPSDFNSRSQLASQNGIQGYTGTQDQNTQLLQILRNISGSPMSGQMVNDITAAAQTGGMTPEERDGLSGLQNTQEEVLTAAAKARAALEANDYTSMNYWVNHAQAQREAFENQLADYYKAIKPLRDQLTQAMTPSEKEQQLNQQLVNIRSQAEQFQLQTEQDKLAEYEGQTLGFAGGRAAELDFKSSFKVQEYALKEKNLLLSLGLEQEARKMLGESAERQMTFLAEDLELQTKVQERLAAYEEKVFERADQLRTESKQTLLSMLDALAGVDPEKMPPEAKKQLETLAARASIPLDLVQAALKTQYQRQVFEDSLKRKDDLLSVSEAKELGVPYGTTKTEAAKLGRVPGASDGGAPINYNGEFSATIDLVANVYGTKDQRNNTRASMQTFIANGDYGSAYTLVSQATASGLKGEAATRYQNQTNALGVVTDLKKAIQAYADAGGKTDIFKGTEDQIQSKIGKLMTDPKYAALAVQIDAAFQQYRLQMTGAAFGPKESAEYASILPSKGNTLDLNLAKLEGATAYFNSSIESSIRSVVGQGGVHIKEYADGAGQTMSIEQVAQQKGFDLQAARAAGYSDEEIKAFLSPQSFNSVGGDTNQAANRPTRNNNPLNIKWSQVTMKYPGVKGKDPKPASDGGYFLTFNSPQDGFNAAKRLITSQNYKNLTVDAALKRWSNKGYGGEIIPALKGKKINQLTPAELDSLIKKMAAREGYKA